MMQAAFRIAIPVATILLYAVLALQPELRLVVPLLVGVTAVISIILAVSRWNTLAADWSTPTILAVAVVIRLFFLFCPPQLSDDIYRYVWDGTRTVQGINPYLQPPALVVPPPRLKEIHSRINHAELHTIYPPAAQIVFAAGAALHESVIGLKTVLVAIDLLFCLLVLLLLKRMRLPLSNAILYAWNPLPVLEIAGAGHVDGVGMAMLAGALALLLCRKGEAPATGPQRPAVIGAGVLAAGAVMVKLFPFVLCPTVSLLVPRKYRGIFWTAFMGSCALLMAIFLPHLANALCSLKKYALDWEFAGFTFTSLRALTGSGSTARLIVAGAFILLLGALFFRQLRDRTGSSSTAEQGRQAVTTCYYAAFAFLMLTPTLQPWYALWLAAFLPFRPGAAGLVLCWVVFLTYQVQIPYFVLGKWEENPYVTAAVFGAPVVAGLATLSGEGRASVKSKDPSRG